MRFLHFSFCFLLVFGITTLAEAQKKSNSTTNTSKSPNSVINKKDSIPAAKEKPSDVKTIDSTQHYKKELLENRNKLNTLQHDFDELLKLTNCNELRTSNNKLSQDIDIKNNLIKENENKIEKLEEDKKELNESLIGIKKQHEVDLNNLDKQYQGKISELKKQHETEIANYKAKSSRIQSFLETETQKIRNEITIILTQSNPNDSNAVSYKIDALKTRITVLKNLTDNSNTLDDLNNNLQDFEKIIKLYSHAYSLLLVDYSEVQIQNTLSQLGNLISKRTFPSSNQYLVAERERLIKLLRKYCLVYEQAYYFYLNAQDWSYIADRDIEAFKANLQKNPKIAEPIDSFPFIKTTIDKLKASPEKDRKKPQNPFKPVNCPKT